MGYVVDVADLFATDIYMFYYLKLSMLSEWILYC